MSIRISLCMIVKNEEDVLKRCLDSAAPIADEIILVDTGSTDRTKEIARTFTDQVYDFLWVDDFAAARNFSFSKAGMEYCMWLDADDVIDPKQQEAFLSLKKTLSPSVDVVMLPYYAAVDDDGEPTFWYYRERIVKNDPRYRWEGQVHEAIVPSGNLLYAKAAVTHRKPLRAPSGRNLRILQKAYRRGELSPRLRFYYGRELYEHQRYAEAIGVLEEFWGEPGGFAENKIDACKVLADCYANQGLREMAYRTLLRSFIVDPPRAEVCCEIGRLFLEDQAYESAIYWYQTAMACQQNPEKGGFVTVDCYGYLPAINLCVCYDRLGDRERAMRYNEEAGRYRPDSAAYLSNKAYFSVSCAQEIKEKGNPL